MKISAISYLERTLETSVHEAIGCHGINICLKTFRRAYVYTYYRHQFRGDLWDIYIFMQMSIYVKVIELAKKKFSTQIF